MTSTRRASGESSVHEGTDGRWHGHVSMGTKVGGKRDRRHVSGATRAGVVAKVRELGKRRDAGVTATSGTMTLAAWLDHWIEYIAVNRVRPRTLEGYRQVIRQHITPAIGHKAAAFCRCAGDGLRAKPLTGRGCHKFLLRAICNTAQDRGACSAVVKPAHGDVHRSQRAGLPRRRPAPAVRACPLPEWTLRGVRPALL